MKELKEILFSALKERGFEIEENTSYFKGLKESKYILGGRIYRKKIRVWVKTKLEVKTEDFKNSPLQPIYFELHKHFQWMSFEFSTEEEIKKLLNTLDNEKELFLK